MKVRELIEALEGMPEDATVMIASQPSWPMQHEVGAVVFPESTCLIDRDGEEWYCETHDESGLVGSLPAHSEQAREKPTVWIAEGSQPYDAPYLPGFARDELGWR